MSSQVPIFSQVIEAGGVSQSELQGERAEVFTVIVVGRLLSVQVPLHVCEVGSKQPWLELEDEPPLELPLEEDDDEEEEEDDVDELPPLPPPVPPLPLPEELPPLDEPAEL